MKLETKEEYLVDSAIEMLYPTVTFNSYEAAVKHIHETPGTWRITKIYRTLPVGEEVTEADDECWCGADSRESGRQTMKATDVEIERRDGSKPGLWSVYWYLGWDVFFSFSLAVGITSKNTMMVIVQAFCLLVFLGLTVWQLNHI